VTTFAPGRVSYSGDTLGGDLVGDQAVGAMLTAGLGAMSDLKIEVLRAFIRLRTQLSPSYAWHRHIRPTSTVFRPRVGVLPTTCARYFASTARTCAKKPSTTTSPR
jgi:hypothetical protein